MNTKELNKIIDGIYMDRILALQKILEVKVASNGIYIKIKNNSGYAVKFFPYTTKTDIRALFHRGFSPVIAEILRIISNETLPRDFDIYKLLEILMSSIKFINDDDEEKLIKEEREAILEVISRYLVESNGDINIFHVKLLKYIHLTKPDKKQDKGKGEAKIAKFIYDLFLRDNEEISILLDDGKGKNLIENVILDNILELEKSKIDKEIKYHDKLQFLTDICKQDIKFLCKHERSFKEHLEKILCFYYYNYAVQMSIKVDKKLQASFEETEKIYYILENEKAGINRKNYALGNKLIAARSSKLLINLHVLEQLNFLFGCENHTMEELYKKFEDADDNTKIKLLNTIKYWIVFYRKNDINLDVLPNSLDKLIEHLEKAIGEKIDNATVIRYPKPIEVMTKKFFSKRGGNCGVVLCLSEELLLVLSALVIKEKRITLKELFKGLELRGICFDKASQGEIRRLFNDLGLVHKKNDGPGEMYVKSIFG